MMTEFVPTFVLSVLAVAAGAAQNPARMLLIVRRPYAYLADRLRKALEGRDDIEVVVDRRRAERRKSDRPVPEERRRTERRTSREEMLQIVIEGNPLTMFQRHVGPEA